MYTGLGRSNFEFDSPLVYGLRPKALVYSNVIIGRLRTSGVPRLGRRVRRIKSADLIYDQLILADVPFAYG